MTARTGAAAALLLLVPPLAACGGPSDDAEDGTTLTVLAAASLTTTFEELAERFEAEHPGVEVRLSFGGSSDLVAQVAEGAAADVVATADTSTMATLVDAGLAAAEPAEFATNTLLIAVPAGNPAGITGLADLADPALAVVVCAPEVPCGRASAELADRAGTRLAADSEEQSVTDVLAKVAAGEADAGLVYATDVASAEGDVEGIDVPEAAEVVNHYPVVVVAGTAEQDLALAWIALVTGPGRAVLADAGFGPPAP